MCGHTAVHITITPTDAGDALTATCARCGVARLDDFALDVVLVTLAGGVPARQTTIRNRTTRTVTVRVNGSKPYRMCPDADGCPTSARMRFV